MVAVGRRYLPRGWADFGLQLAIWFAFVFAYQLARGVANRESPQRAFANSWRVVNIETHFTHRLYELTFQQFVDQRHWLALAVSWTYWNSEFTVLGLGLLYVYMPPHDAFTRFRHTILLANALGLFGYVFMPTAPTPLLGPGVAGSHTHGLVPLAPNPH